MTSSQSYLRSRNPRITDTSLFSSQPRTSRVNNHVHTASGGSLPTKSMRKISTSFNQRLGRQSVASTSPNLFRRKIIFPFNDNNGPVFPFNEAALNLRSPLRWPAWPHRLDNGFRKVNKSVFDSHTKPWIYLGLGATCFRSMTIQ